MKGVERVREKIELTTAKQLTKSVWRSRSTEPHAPKPDASVSAHAMLVVSLKFIPLHKSAMCVDCLAML